LAVGRSIGAVQSRESVRPGAANTGSAEARDRTVAHFKSIPVPFWDAIVPVGQKGKIMEIFFCYEKATKRKYRYFECTAEGVPVEYGSQVVGTLYISQDQFPPGKPSPTLLVNVLAREEIVFHDEEQQG